MSASNSPAFNPPMNRVIDSDPQIVRVDLGKTDWGARKSSQKDISNTMGVRNILNSGAKGS